MMRVLRHLRDFLTPEQMKWLVGSLQVENCILLRQSVIGKDGISKLVVQVFDHNGTYVGEIPEPDFIPGCQS